MFLQLIYSMVRLIIEVFLIRRQTDGELRAELLALRHQLRVLERQVNRSGNNQTG